MRRNATIGALLLIAVGVALGATVFRTDIAQATGLAQAVTVDNTAANPVPVREQNLDSGSIKVREQGTVKVTADEEPYEHVDFFNQTAATCTQFVCHVTFPAVPAGKRLVITYASARWALTAGGNFAIATVGINGNDSTDPQILLPAAVQVGTVNWVAAGPVTLYAEAGDVPTMSLQGQFVQPVSNTAEASIVGHLVDAS
jgi:hypothetical protein